MLRKAIDLLEKEKILTTCVISEKLKISTSKAETLFQIMIDQGIVNSTKVEISTSCAKCKGNCMAGICN
jgi:predicted transcriptional regulator